MREASRVFGEVDQESARGDEEKVLVPAAEIEGRARCSSIRVCPSEPGAKEDEKENQCCL